MFTGRVGLWEYLNTQGCSKLRPKLVINNNNNNNLICIAPVCAKKTSVALLFRS